MDVIDLTMRPADAARWKILAGWWPHPLHGDIIVKRRAKYLLFKCACGERLKICRHVARELGI